jgi:hypothetical protein
MTTAELKAHIEARLMANRRLADPPQHRRNKVLGKCWEWTKSVNEDGYGRMALVVDKVRTTPYVHRAAAFIYHDMELDSPAMALHDCDNPRCFSPLHLKVSDCLQNNRDTAEHGRHRTCVLDAKQKALCIKWGRYAGGSARVARALGICYKAARAPFLASTAAKNGSTRAAPAARQFRRSKARMQAEIETAAQAIATADQPAMDYAFCGDEVAPF